MPIFRASDGTTIETISIEGQGQYLLPRWPNGRSRGDMFNPRGWVRTPAELTALGIDLGSLREICVRCRQPLPPKESPA